MGVNHPNDFGQTVLYAQTILLPLLTEA